MAETRRAFRWIPTVMIVGLVVAVGCGGGSKGGGGPTAPPITTVPTTWGGVWSVNTQAKLCNTTDVLFDSTLVDTLCPGAPIASMIDFGDTVCAHATVTGTASSATFSCTDTLSLGDCVGTLTVTYTSTVNSTAGTFHGTGKIQLDSPNPLCDLCIDITQTGTRTATTPAVCSPTLRGFFRGVPSSRSWLRTARR